MVPVVGVGVVADNSLEMRIFARIGEIFMLRMLWMICLAMTLTACDVVKIHEYKAYQGSYPNDKLAVLHVPFDIKVKSINGQGEYYPKRVSNISPYSGARIELPPGYHVINVMYYSRSHGHVAHSKSDTKLKLKAEPGKEYYIFNGRKIINNQVYITYEIWLCGGEKEREFSNKMKKEYEGSIATYIPACGK